MSHNESQIPGKGPSIFAFSDKDAREAALRDAIEAEKIDVLFQPQVDAFTGKIVGAEALARCSHPKLGELGADELFAMARSADLIPALSRQVMDKSLILARDWRDDLRLSINVSPVELESPRFEAKFAKLMSKTGFPVDRLVIEITEDQPLSDLHAAAEFLGRLRSSGIGIALDDFGAGYCNFNYLKRLPVDTIKLDRSIISGIVENSRDLVIMRSITSLAKALDLIVVAEGIETEAQRKIATEEGCAYLQGFLIAEPTDSRTLQELAAA